MAKERTPFEKTAAALKIMGKKIAAKKTEPRREHFMSLEAVFKEKPKKVNKIMV